MILNQHRLKDEVLALQLTGKPLSGMFPHEVQWLLSKIRGVTGDILEIGTFKGATTREIATAYPYIVIHTIDNCDPSYGLNPDEVGMECKDLPNVKLTIEDSGRYAFPPNLGMIIIDGDNTWEGVRRDTEKALDYFRNRHGTIVWHDFDVTHQVWWYLDWLFTHSRRDLQLVQSTQLVFLDL